MRRMVTFIFSLALALVLTVYLKYRLKRLARSRHVSCALLKATFLEIFCLSSCMHYLYLAVFVCSESMRLTEASN